MYVYCSLVQKIKMKTNLRNVILVSSMTFCELHNLIFVGGKGEICSGKYLYENVKPSISVASLKNNLQIDKETIVAR
jgi:hypothetical protein